MAKYEDLAKNIEELRELAKKKLEDPRISEGLVTAADNVRKGEFELSLSQILCFYGKLCKNDENKKMIGYAEFLIKKIESVMRCENG